MVKLLIQDAVFLWYEKHYNVKPLLSKASRKSLSILAFQQVNILGPERPVMRS